LYRAGSLIQIKGVAAARDRVSLPKQGPFGMHFSSRRAMYKKVLLPTDGSPVSRKAVKQGIAFAKAVGATVVGFFSPEEYPTAMNSEYFPLASYLSRPEF
jgi:hypothetical protein